MVALISLFFAALIAATILPAQSEAVLVVLMRAGDHLVAVLLAVATVGNVLGSVLNWVLGRYLIRFSARRWFPVSEHAVARAQGWYGRYGYWSLLLSWVHIVGDPLTVAAGMMREPLLRFICIVTLAKGGRYLVLALVTLAWLPGAA